MEDFLNRPENLVRQRLYEQLVIKLENLIVTGGIQPGSKLPSERELAEHFATSRTVVREAMKVLKSKGLVAVHHGSGVIVRPSYSWNLIDPLVLKVNGSWGHLLEVRQILEVEIAALASQRWVEPELDAIRQAGLRMEVEIGEPSKRMEHDMAFHRAIAEASHNPLLPRVLESVAHLFIAQRRALLNVPGAPERSVVAHRQIYNAIAARNAGEAAQAMLDHLQVVKGEFRELGWADERLLPMGDLGPPIHLEQEKGASNESRGGRFVVAPDGTPQEPAGSSSARPRGGRAFG